ncbi:uncharacterized protein LOC129907694 [Episyrphus balteatus]|uniref:uncharacterized protein LOC129907694 n=1 Tax=Episyrphus balteatus TaxID=286459 RepID=UPI002485E784|nr:uncharacterized protein LOC129907694 [Episyrphus balteatus]
MAANKSINAKFIALLIEEYRALPSLWEVESDGYKNKHIKAADYNHLLTIMRAIDPLLTMQELKKKIAGVRTCYRRELKKVLKSSGKGKRVYIPSLWYFDDIDFLRHQEPKSPGPRRNALVKTADGDDDEHVDEEDDGDEDDNDDQDDCNNHFEPEPDPIEEEVDQKPILRKYKIKARKSKELKRSFFTRNTFVAKSVTHSDVLQPQAPQQETKKDDSTIFSESWAILFRKLSPEQQLYGKRCIDEVLYQGQLGNLNSHTYRNIEGYANESTAQSHHQGQPSYHTGNVKPIVVNEIDPSFDEL